MKGFTPTAHRRLFKQLDRGLDVLKLERITSFLRERDLKRKGLKPPKADRIRETESQYSYQSELDGYKLVVHSSYNPNLPNGRSLGRFSFLGRISVLVVNTVTDEKDYQIYFSRAGAFVERTLKEVEFLKLCLSERPCCPQCEELMTIHQSYVSAWWSCDEHPKEKRAFVPSRLSVKLQKHRESLRGYKTYYEKVTRKKTPRKRMRKIRKPWLKKKSAA
jgi:hypothetical protein